MSRRVRACVAGLSGEITSAPVTNASLRALRAEAAAALARQHPRFASAFSDALLASFSDFTRPPAAKAPGQWLDLGAFEIMDESRIQDEIEIAQVVQILNEDCGLELRRLIKFEAALRRHDTVRVTSSTIGPPCLARALWSASDGLGLSAPVRAELVRCVARWLAPRLGEIYAAVRQAGFADASHLEAADRASDDSEGTSTAAPVTATFEAAVDRLAQWQRKQAQRRLTSVEGALDLLRRNASLEDLVAEARARLQRKLDSAQPPSQTKRFILTLWSLVVAQEWTTLAPGARRNSPAMDTAVDVIWSTDAARSRADSPTLVAMIPELVERLTAGMATVKLSDAMKKAWLEQLAAIHLHAMRRPTGEPSAAGPVTVDLELDDELPPAPPPRAADSQSPIAGLQIGDHVTLQLDGDWTDLQLLWMSDNGYFLLFAGAGEGSRSFTRKALDKMFEQGLLRTAESSSALQRASDEIIRRRS